MIPRSEVAWVAARYPALPPLVEHGGSLFLAQPHAPSRHLVHLCHMCILGGPGADLFGTNCSIFLARFPPNAGPRFAAWVLLESRARACTRAHTQDQHIAKWGLQPRISRRCGRVSMARRDGFRYSTPLCPESREILSFAECDGILLPPKAQLAHTSPTKYPCASQISIFAFRPKAEVSHSLMLVAVHSPRILAL